MAGVSGKEKLGGVKGKKTIIRIYYTNFFSIKMEKNLKSIALS